MARNLVFVVAVVLPAIVATSCQSRTVETKAEPLPVSLGTLNGYRRTTAPFAYLQFCRSTPSQCEPQQGEDHVVMNGVNQEKISALNYFVNHTITPKDDPPGQDIWTLNPTAGDCEDYAVTKRKDLLDTGIPGRAMRLAVGTTPDGVAHAVVVIRTQQGDIVLDNRFDDILPFKDTDITWTKIQSADNPKVWYSL